MADTRSRKRVNKNKKRNWRKHVDITEVEDHLEDQRLQERTGGLAADKTNEQLFFIDKATLDDGQVTLPVKKKRRKGVDQLKCYSALLPDPNIKPARIAHNVKVNQKISAGRKLRLELGVKSAKEKLADKHSQLAVVASRQKRRVKNHQNRATYDLWANEDKVGDSIVSCADEHYLKATRKRRVNVPKHYRERPSGLAAVEVPHPGASYNPALDDYQELLSKAHVVEIIKDKKERQILRATDEKFPDKKDAPTEASYLREMSAGLFEGGDDEKTVELPSKYGESSSEQEEGRGEDRLSVNPPVRREDKKTVTQRNKVKRFKEEEKKAHLEKEKKKKKHEMMRLKAIKREVLKKEECQQERANHKRKIQERFKNKPKRLGLLKYEAPDMEIKLSEELQGSLRLLKPEGHLLEDRFKSLQRRNIIEPRKRAKRLRKYKLKEFEKKSHKDIIS